MIVPLQILSEFNSEKNYDNWSTFAEFIIKIKVAYFFSETPCKCTCVITTSATVVLVATVPISRGLSTVPQFGDTGGRSDVTMRSLIYTNISQASEQTEADVLLTVPVARNSRALVDWLSIVGLFSRTAKAAKFYYGAVDHRCRHGFKVEGAHREKI